MLRRFTRFSAFIGLLLCLATAGTGIYWGVVLKKGSESWREIHLNLAISCVFVSAIAHSLSLVGLRKPKD